MNALVELVLPIAEAARAELLGAAGVFARIGAAAFLLPLFGERVVPARIRLVLALALTAVVAPVVAPGLPERAGPLFLIGEAAAGLLIGFGLRALVMALQIAGSVAAQAVSLSQLLGSPVSEPLPAIGHVLTVAALALAALAGLPAEAAAALAASYEALPAGLGLGAGEGADWTIARAGAAFALGVRLAAGFVAVGLAYNLALGVVSRAMPQLMVALVGAPAISLAALALLAATAPLLLPVWLDALGDRLRDPLGP
ncbi:flagellar biosynthetic protein FliR [Hasllibacter halocynthiae]|uniref:Flagellar biosynthetic protein FliR n=1 Tax=Hasllibacter halocynthiae TaxID=595589 RepID=A0A2T0X2T3_9RHOB|nr:flagellar biosynthetic protein FliR [Hasllibacter halocynthiae]PRY93205.1 flagellar biosynthetic protein FliR [Hasllibacter halocynthiae]